MVTHTQNLCSAFTHTAMNTHIDREHTPGAVSHLCCGARGAVGGSVPGFGCRECCTFTPPTIPAQDLHSQPFDYESNSLTIRPWLPLSQNIFISSNKDFYNEIWRAQASGITWTDSWVCKPFWRILNLNIWKIQPKPEESFMHFNLFGISISAVNSYPLCFKSSNHAVSSGSSVIKHWFLMSCCIHAALLPGKQRE